MKNDFNQNYYSLKKWIYKVVTKNYSISLLVLRVNATGRNRFVITQVWSFLDSEECRSKKKWNKLREQFFEEFKKEIYELTGFGKICNDLIFTIKYPEFWLELMGLSLKMGIIQDVSYTKMANLLAFFGNLPYKEETIRKKMEEADTGTALALQFRKAKQEEQKNLQKKQGRLKK